MISNAMQAMKIIDFKRKKNVINKRAAGLYENAKICYISKGKFENKRIKDKTYC